MMNKETELDMNELISDFDEYSTDYTKTACTYYANYLREYQKEKLDLQQRIEEAIDYIRKCCNMDSKFVNLHFEYAQNEMSSDQVDELLEILGGKE